MDAENIVQDLKRRFAAPLPEFYKRRIIFWHDEERDLDFTLYYDIIKISRKSI